MEVNAINAALKNHPNKKQIQKLLNQKDKEDLHSIPSGLMEDVFSRSNKSIKDIELKDMVERAVKDANLNVTERMALNETFFPNGGGFELFPEDTYAHELTIYYNPIIPPENDEFVNKTLKIKVPDYVSVYKYIFKDGKKPSLTLNLESALSKLKNILKNK